MEQEATPNPPMSVQEQIAYLDGLVASSTTNSATITSTGGLFNQIENSGNTVHYQPLTYQMLEDTIRDTFWQVPPNYADGQVLRINSIEGNFVPEWTINARRPIYRVSTDPIDQPKESRRSKKSVYRIKKDYDLLENIKLIP